MGRNGLWRPRKHLYENFAKIAAKESQPVGSSANTEIVGNNRPAFSNSRATNLVWQALGAHRHASQASSRAQKRCHNSANPVKGSSSAQGQHLRRSTRPTQHVCPAVPAAAAGANSSMATQPNSGPSVVIMDAQSRFLLPNVKFGEFGELSTLSDAFARQLGQEIMLIPPGPVLRAATTTPAFPGKTFEPDRFVNVPVLLVAGYSQPLLNRAFVVLDPEADTDGHDIYIGRALVDQLKSVSQAPVTLSATSRPAVSILTMTDPCVDHHDAEFAEENLVPIPQPDVSLPPEAIRSLSGRRAHERRWNTQLSPESAHHDKLGDDENHEAGSYRQQQHSTRFSASAGGPGWTHVSQTSIPAAAPSSCNFSHSSVGGPGKYANLSPMHVENRRRGDSIVRTLAFGLEEGVVELASHGSNVRRDWGDPTDHPFQGESWLDELNSEATKERQPHIRVPGLTYNPPSMDNSFQFPIPGVEPRDKQSRINMTNFVPWKPPEPNLRAHRPSKAGYGPSGSSAAWRDTGQQ